MMISIVLILLLLLNHNNANIESSHRCVGWHFTTNSWLTQSCYYKNICYVNNYDYNGWLYVKSNEDMVTTTEDLIVSLLPQTTTDDNMWGRKITMKIINADEAISMNLMNLPLRNDRIHILYESYIASNFGHFLADELLPLYALSYRFGMTNKMNGIQVMQWKDIKPMEWSCDDLTKEKARGVSNQFMRQECAKFYLHVFPLVTPVPLQLLSKDNDSFCVSDMLAGIGWLTDHCYDATNHGRNNVMPNCPLTGQLLWDFRSHLMNNNYKISNTSNNDKPMIPLLVSGFDHKRAPVGMRQKVENIASNFNITASTSLMHQLSISEQIDLISRVKLFITTTGGASMISLFLPEGSSVILIAGNDGYLDHNFYSFLAHLNVYFIKATDGQLDETQLRSYIRKLLYIGDKKYSSFSGD